MYEKVMNVFYGTDLLPYKDKERQVHYPITGNAFLGASNTTQIRFFIDKIGNYTDTWVANSKLPNGKLGNKVLSSGYDSEIGEHYVYLDLNSYYTQAKGDLYISLNGFVGGITITESGGQYSISGIPTIQATGVIKIAINYATPLIDGDEVETITLQQLLAIIGSKLPKNDNKYLKIVDSYTNLNTQTYEDYVFANDIVYFVDSGELSKISGTYPNLTRNNITIYAYNVEGGYGSFEVLESAVSIEVPSFNAIKDESNVSLPTYLTNNYVDKTTNQSIGGNKTFDGQILFQENVSFVDDVLFDEYVDFEGLVEFRGSIKGTLLPQESGTYELGSSSFKWKDLYLSGSLKDGTNSIAINDIATKQMIDDLKRNSFISVNTTTYPTLNSFLQSTGEEGYIYLYPVNTSDLTKGYWQYIWENDDWVSLGSTKLDLSDYYDKDEVDTLLADKLDKVVYDDSLIVGDLPFSGLFTGIDFNGIFYKQPMLNNRARLTVISSHGYWTKSGSINGNTMASFFETATYVPYANANTTTEFIEFDGSGTGTFTSDEMVKIASSNCFIYSTTGVMFSKVKETTTEIIYQSTSLSTIDIVNGKFGYKTWEITINKSTGAFTCQGIEPIYYNYGAVDTLLSAKENVSNKVTTLSASSTDTQYPSAKVVWDTAQNIREVAEGKCQAFVLHDHSYSITNGTVRDDTTGTNVLVSQFYVYDTTTNKWKNDITGLISGNYSGITIINQNFNSQDNLVQLENGYVLAQKDNGYYLLNFTQISVEGINIGDILLIIETDVPDRWYGGTTWQIGQSPKSKFYNMETAKVPLENYWAKSELVAITTSEWNTMIGD